MAFGSVGEALRALGRGEITDLSFCCVAADEVERLERELSNLRALYDEALSIKPKQTKQMELAEAKEVIRDLLTSYLASFDGNKDELALRAERILEK